MVFNISGLGLLSIEPENREILALSISKERNVFVAERYLSGLAKVHGRHPVSTDSRTGYPKACRFLNLKHHIHSFLAKKEKSLIERTMQYIKDRTECFDDYFPCKLKNSKLKHVRNWLQLFVDYYNSELKMLKRTESKKLFECLYIDDHQFLYTNILNLYSKT